MEAKKYQYLFSPGQIGNLILKNRIIMPAMATNFASETGGMTEHLINYYKERATGGVGLIIIENTVVDYPIGRNGATQIRLDDDRFIPGLSRLVQEIHAEGAKIALQINHCGGLTDQSKTEGNQPVSCSPKICSQDGVVPRELTITEIHNIIQKFGQAALRAKKAGFDAIEIHGGHGYLIAQFMSPYNNQRQDEYGGSLEGRIRFPLEILKEVKEKVGINFPVIFRISAKEFIAGGRELPETIKVAKFLEKEGIHALSVTVATGFNVAKQIEPIPYPQGWRVHYSKSIKDRIHLPIITVGVIREPEFADKVIKDGNADFVAIGRGLIADPMWPKKAFNGKEDEICKCISCNDGCINNRGYKDLPITCSVNPAVGREYEFNHLVVTNRPKNIVIIGGGPAGMEAARIARLKGHKVILFEQESELGGQMRLAAIPPGKDKIRWFIDYLSNQMRSLQVDVRLNTPVDSMELLKEIMPDVLILACGSKPIIPNIPGLINSDHVITAHEMLRKDMILKKKNIVVIGGGLVGCETAEYLKFHDNQVTIVEMLADIALDVNPVYREDILERLAKNKIRILTSTRLEEIQRNLDKYVVINRKENGEIESIDCDDVVLACGARPNRELEVVLKPYFNDYYLVGDCNCPGKILDAVYHSATTLIHLID